ncbi:(Fe-S)-binding protein [Nocardioides sp. Kera G14]|uniref:(Fe-S)-binding protein n=1 Tax=Nocardioides sp. Kera G14 TaxID=2884264 RepID=UPI001D123746|nr:(Fe-S)-binding protein [Nocardioides sp. Kera G14]UDY23219.1 4Fe-4S dicluster domain-containing protein [Nocardioides sp. Kera G14]
MLQVIAIVLCLALTVVAVALTVRAVRSMLQVLGLGQPAVGRTNNPGRRLATMLKETVLHTRMLQWTWVGILHWFAFAAFLFLSTAVASAYFQLFSPEFAWPIIGKWFVYEWLGEGLGLLGTLGIIPLIIYRLTHMPKDQGRTTRFFGSTMWQAFFVEAMVLLESCAILFIRGAEYNYTKASEHAEHADAFHFPLAQYFSHLFPTSQHGSEQWIYAIAAFKIASAMIWLIVISTNLTMGVAWHRFTAWFNIFYKRESVGRDTDGKTLALGALKPLISDGKVITLDDVDDLDEDAKLGAGSIQDFSWKGILDFTTCTECGRCQSQCPAWNTEKPLSPKLLVMGLREHAYAAAPYMLADGEAPEGDVLTKPLIGKTDKPAESGASTEVLDWFYNPEDGGFVIDEDVLWSCTSCGACVQQCPVDIEHVDHIVDMRRYQVLVESNFPSELNGLFKGLENKGNPWNMSSTARMDWAKGLDFDVKVVGEDIESLDEVDWLFWVGCAGAYEDRAKKTTRAVAELLDIAGISFGVLGNGETCSGDSARRAGNEFLFQGLAQQNVETFKEFKVKKAVTTCAHCFNTLKNEYKEFGIELEVVHHTQLLNKLVREGRLTPVNDGAGAHKRSITYHDPCYIGRHNGVYTPPRELLQVLPGAEYVEMPRNSEKSFCCGAGGARMWMEEKLGSRINQNRTDEAVATGADQIAVGCPFCRVMLSDGLTAAQAAGSAREEVEVLDVAQMLLASVKGEQATKLAPGAGAANAAAVATAAEPSAGDVTAQGDTVVDTEDVGPAAKASGGSSTSGSAGSLFDTPASTEEKAPDDASSLFDTPAPSEPASGGTSGGSLFDTPAPSEPEAKAAPAEAPKQDGDLGSGGSLFDVGGEAEAPAASEAKAAPAEAAPPATEKPDLGSGGSLFDIPAGEAPATPAEPAAQAAPEAKAAPAEPAAPAAPAEPAVDLNAGGSLFDIPATPAPEAAPAAEASTAAAPAAAKPAGASVPADSEADTPAASASPAEEAQVAPNEAVTPEAPAAPAPAAAPSGTASEPRTDVNIDEVSSLFDIEAPSGSVSVAAGTVAPAAAAGAAPPATADSSGGDTPVATEAADVSEVPATEATTPAAPEAPTVDTVVEDADTSTGTTSPVATETAVVSEAPATEATVPQAPAAPVSAAPAGPSSGTASVPHSDVKIDEVSSLFDIPAPEGAVSVEPGSAPAAVTSPAQAAPAETAQAAAQPAATEAAGVAEAPATEATPTAEPEAGVSEADAEPAESDEAPAAPVPSTPSTPSVTIGESSGATHEPRTDVDIHGAESLFDL